MRGHHFGWLLLLSAGCLARPTSDAPPVDPGPAAPTPPPTSGTPPAVTPPDSTPDVPACAVPPTPLRRLSRFEYARTLRDLFPEIAPPPLSLPHDPAPHEFDNDAEALQPTTPLLEAYAEVAREVAARAIGDALACRPTDPTEQEACARAFVAEQGRRIFRRPLTASEVDAYSVMFEEAPAEADFEDRAQLTLQLLLSAPEFLYRFERARAPLSPGASGPIEAFSLAARLSYFLWASTPDEALLEAAATGRLDTPEGLRSEAERLLADPRAREAFAHVFAQWLDFDRLDRVSKIEADGFDAALRAAMREESARFVDRLFDQGGPRALLTASTTEVDARLAALYGVPAPASGWAEVALEDRAGFLGQATFLASHGHPDKPSPVLRGVFVLERLLCLPLGAPPPNAEAMGAAAADEVEGPLTNRERYALMTADASCRSCHDTINPVGFAFEGYDTMGRFRTEEPNGLEIDASGQLGDLAFVDATDFTRQLADDPRVESCAVKKWVRYAFAGGPAERQACLLEQLEASAREAGGDFRQIMLAIVTSPAFSTLSVPPEAP